MESTTEIKDDDDGSFDKQYQGERRFSYNMNEESNELPIEGWQKASKAFPNQPLGDNLGRRFSYKIDEEEEDEFKEKGWVNISDISLETVKETETKDNEAFALETTDWERTKHMPLKFDELPLNPDWIPVGEAVVEDTANPIIPLPAGKQRKHKYQVHPMSDDTNQYTSEFSKEKPPMSGKYGSHDANHTGNVAKLIKAWSIESEPSPTVYGSRFGRRSSLPAIPTKMNENVQPQLKNNNRRGSLMPSDQMIINQSQIIKTKMNTHQMGHPSVKEKLIRSVAVEKELPSNLTYNAKKQGNEDDSDEYDPKRRVNEDDRDEYDPKRRGNEDYNSNRTSLRDQDYRPRDPSPDYD